MHARHSLAILFLLAGASLAPACAVMPENLPPIEEDTADAAEAQEDAFRFHACKGNHFACMAECSRQGTPCGPAASHPTDSTKGLGLLFGCITTGRRACAYRYPGGDKCFYPKDEGPAFCV